MSQTRCRPICWRPLPGGSAPANQVYNVAVGERTTLNVKLYAQIRRFVAVASYPQMFGTPSQFIATSASATRATARPTSARRERLLGYAPAQRIAEGLKLAMRWYVREVARENTGAMP